MTNVAGVLLFFGVAFVLTLACLEMSLRVGRRALFGSDAARPAGLESFDRYLVDVRNATR